MPFYHATHRHKLASIIEHGLGAKVAARNFDCEPGVYLSSDPIIAVSFLIEHYLNDPGALAPKDAFADFVVIVVDDSRVSGRLEADPNVAHLPGLLFRHHGVIDVRGMPVVDASALTP